MPGTTPQLSFREALGIRAVRRLWFAQIVSVFGDFLAVFAVFSVVTFELHGTPVQLALIMVAFLTPFAFVSPLAGVYVDKWNVKATMIASDLIRGVLVISLLFVRDLYAIYAIFFALSTVSSFFVPAQSVAIRALAPMEGLMAVNALMQQAVQGSQIIAPALAGLLVQFAGSNPCFVFDSFSFFFSAAMVATLAIHRAPAAAGAAGTVLASLREGFRFIFTHSAISFVLVSMASGMFAVRCFGTLLSIYVRDILHSTADVFGYLNSLIGIGMIAGSQILPRLARRVSKPQLVLYGLNGMGLAVLLTAVFQRISTTALAMLGLGFAAAFIMISASTLMQQETPHELLGRVSSSMMCMMAVAQVVAMFVAGPVAERAGIRSLYFGSAAMLVAIALIGFARLRGRAEIAASAAATAAD
jgi:DHA3 family macrolide efflux protein-like MFS transporter